jgi:hypothetical protein
MTEREKVVMRFNDGRVLKGYLSLFSPELPEAVLEEEGAARAHKVSLRDVKAVFFVKSFDGNRGYKERKTYGISRTKGRNKVFIKFNDGESLVGFLEGGVPWEKGFFLSRQGFGATGFFLLPVDDDTNNIKVFVVASSVSDVTVVP